MVFVVVIALFALGVWTLVGTFRRLCSRRVGIAWWLAFGGLVVVGAVAGYWLAFAFEYSISPQLRLVSFPIPVCVFHFEHGQWVDFPLPSYISFSAAFTNVFVITAFAVLPLLAISLFLPRQRIADHGDKLSGPYQ